jgi:hypothetical protein
MLRFNRNAIANIFIRFSKSFIAVGKICFIATLLLG